MGYDYSWHKELDTDSEHVREQLGITILSKIKPIESVYGGNDSYLYEFEMGGEVYVEYVKHEFTGYGNTSSETISFVKKSELQNVPTTVRSVDQGDPCKECLAFDWTITKQGSESSVKCNACGHEAKSEDFFLDFDEYMKIRNTKNG